MARTASDLGSSGRVAHRSEKQVIGFLAFLSVILAFGVDSMLPAFDKISEQFDLGPGSGSVSVVITWYLLGMAAGQMFWGLLADRFGRRPVLLAGLLLFCVGALGAGFAQSMNGLLAMRFIWGLGAASPSAIRLAIARDLYSGDQMARVISFVMAVFLLGPAVAPAVGEGILFVGNWRTVCIASAPLAAVAMYWTVRFGESLPVANRRPIDLGATGRGVLTVCGTRVTIGYTLASMFTFGAFFVYLGSAASIIDGIYGLDSYFALIFGGTALVLAVAVLISERFVRVSGSERVSTTALFVMLVISAVFTGVALAAGGVPSFWLWYLITTLLGAFTTAFTPNASALAMQPMQRIAGAASGVYGVVTIGGGSVLANLVDRRIDETVTPMAVGNIVYTAIAIGLVYWARGGSPEIVDPDMKLNTPHFNDE